MIDKLEDKGQFDPSTVACLVIVVLSVLWISTNHINYEPKEVGQYGSIAISSEKLACCCYPVSFVNPHPIPTEFQIIMISPGPKYVLNKHCDVGQHGLCGIPSESPSWILSASFPLSLWSSYVNREGRFLSICNIVNEQAPYCPTPQEIAL